MNTQSLCVVRLCPSDDRQHIRFNAAFEFYTLLQSKPVGLYRELFPDWVDEVALATGHLRRLFGRLSADPRHTYASSYFLYKDAREYFDEQQYEWYKHRNSATNDSSRFAHRERCRAESCVLRCDPGDAYDIETTSGVQLLRQTANREPAQLFLLPMLANPSIEIAARSHMGMCKQVLNGMVAAACDLVSNERLTNHQALDLGHAAAQDWHFPDLLKLHHDTKGNPSSRISAYYHGLLIRKQPPSALSTREGFEELRATLRPTAKSLLFGSHFRNCSMGADDLIQEAVRRRFMGDEYGNRWWNNAQKETLATQLRWDMHNIARNDARCVEHRLLIKTDPDKHIANAAAPEPAESEPTDVVDGEGPALQSPAGRAFSVALTVPSERAKIRQLIQQHAPRLVRIFDIMLEQWQGGRKHFSDAEALERLGRRSNKTYYNQRRSLVSFLARWATERTLPPTRRS